MLQVYYIYAGLRRPPKATSSLWVGSGLASEPVFQRGIPRRDLATLALLKRKCFKKLLHSRRIAVILGELLLFDSVADEELCVFERLLHRYDRRIIGLRQRLLLLQFFYSAVNNAVQLVLLQMNQVHDWFRLLLAFR